MKKRVLAMLLALALVLSMVPVAAVAGGTVEKTAKAGKHTEAAHACEACGSTQWQSWGQSDSLPTEGHFYLTEDVKLSGMVIVKAGKQLHICLNGFVLTADDGKRLMSASEAGAQIVITDCTAYTDESGVYHAGAMTGGEDASSGGGGAVYVSREAVCKLYDGRIIGNIHKNDSTGGGAIFVNGKNDTLGAGSFYMYGGEISYNKAYKANGKDYRYGGAIYAHTAATVEITGGILKGNEGGRGGVIYASGAHVTVKNTKLTGNVGGSGGVIGLYSKAEVTLENCVMTGNSANNGSAIYGEGTSTVAIKDCSITGNTGKAATVEYSAAMYLVSATAKLSGKTVIADNTTTDANIPDVVLNNASYDTLKIHELTEGSRVVFATPKTAAVEAKEVLVLDAQQTAPWQSKWVKYMTADGSLKDVSLEDGVFVWGHCHDGQAFEALENADQLVAGGHYYLAGDLTMDDLATLDTKNLTLEICLNGHSLTPAEGQQLLAINGRREITVTIDDCTAYTDSSGVYHAGTITGANNTVNGSVFKIGTTDLVELKNGKLTGNKGSNGGAVIVDGTFKLSGGEISNNKAYKDNVWKNGGAIYVNSTGIFEMTGGTIKNNEGQNGGAIYSTGAVNVLGGQIIDNTAHGEGGALYLNSAKNKDYTGTAVLKDVTITGNTAGSTGAVLAAGKLGTLTLSGNTKITGNTAGGAAANLYLLKDYAGVDAAALTGKVGVTLQTSRIEAGQMHMTTVLPEGVDLTQNFSSDDSTYTVELSEGKQMVLAESTVTPPPPPAEEDHSHCACGEDDCTAHTKIEYKKWTDPNALPSSGSWYLATDVTVAACINLTENVDICLNGYSISPTEGNGTRMYTAASGSDVKLTVADCTAKTENGVYSAGKITGFNGTKQGAVLEFKNGTTFELYDGIITGNSNTAAGGALFIQKATFNMFGGEISGNRAGTEAAPKNGGGLYQNGGTFTMTGGSFLNNHAKEGGAFFTAVGTNLDIANAIFSGNTATGTGGAIVSRAEGVATVKNCTITDNTAAAAAGIFCASTMRIENCTITGNTADSAAGVQVYGGSQLTLAGKNTITGNKAGGNASNLCLAETVVFAVENIDTTGTVSLSAVDPGRPVSAPCEDCVAGFTSDDSGFAVTYQDGALYLGISSDHQHCFCAGASDQCAHETVTYAKWTDPKSLPSSGNWYLDTDVVIKPRVAIKAGKELNLCLNGHTITTNDYRAFYLFDDAVLRISDCTDKPGSITGATSGAIMTASDSDGALIELYNGSLTGNESTSTGGAILIQGKTTFNMYGGAITGNAARSQLKTDENGNVILNEDGSQAVTSERGGGGVSVYGENAVFHMYGGEISKNEATAVAYLDKDGKSAETGGYGGGIYCYKGKVYIHGGKITGNKSGRSGGGLFTVTGALIDMSGGEISGNEAKLSGGAFYSSSKGTVNISGGKISGNSAGSYGGALYANTGNTITMTGGAISGNKSGKSGGAAVLSGKDVVMTISGGAVSGNAGSSGGGILVQSGATLKLSGGKISNNTSRGTGGGVYISGDSFLTMTGGSITGNYSKGDAGGLMLVRCTANISGGSISNNESATSGGAIKISGAKANISGLSLVGNKAGKHAGAIVTGSSAKNGVTYYANANLTNCYIANNSCAKSGGAILAQSVGTEFYMKNCKVIGNEASSSAGGIYVSANVVFSMEGGQIAENVSANAAGGIRMAAVKEVTLDGVEIARNEARSTGGGIYISGKETAVVNLRNLKIHENKAVSGGGMYATKLILYMDNVESYGHDCEKAGGGMYIGANSKGSLQNVHVHDNKTGLQAGGIFFSNGSTFTADNLVVENNHTDGDGGGLWNRAALTITNSSFRNNTAGNNGGGIHTYMCSSQWVQDTAGTYLTDSQITGNAAGAQGGGMYIHRGGPAYLKNVTITGNESGLEGSAILADGKMELANVTVTGNTSLGGKYAVYLTPAQWDGHTYYSGMKKITGDMIVKDNEGGDMYLAEQIALAVSGNLGDKAEIHVELSDGVVTQRVIGLYNYDGGNLSYVLTAGDRSVTDPEAPVEEPVETPTEPEITEPGGEQKQPSGSNAVVYAGIGVLVLVIAAAAVILVLLGRKKAGKTAKEADRN